MLKIFRNLKPYTFYICGALTLILLQVMSDLYLPTLMSNIVNNGIMKSDVSYIWKTGGYMLLITAGGGVCAICASFFGSKTSVGSGKILRNKIFRHVEGFSLHEFDKFGASTLITRTTNDIIQIQTVTILISNMMVRAPLMAVGGSILAYSKDQGLTVILAAALPIIAIVIGLFIWKGMPYFKKIQTKIDKINLVLRENLTGSGSSARLIVSSMKRNALTKQARISPIRISRSTGSWRL